MEETDVYQDPMEETIEPAVEPEESATSEQEAETTTAPETTPEPEKKTGAQSRIDELTKYRREAERERDYWREQAMRQAPQETKPPTQQQTVYPDLPEPKSEDFETYNDYVDARADYRSELKLRQRDEAQQARQRMEEQTKVNQRKEDWHKQARDKHQDWDEIFNHPNLPISDAMGMVFMESNQGHDLAYYLGKNPAKAQRIYNLPAGMQAYELGKLETKLAAPPQRTNTKAPNTTSPVGGREMPSKKLEDMDDTEYTATREKQLGYR